jgi:hypothetical protein
MKVKDLYRSLLRLYPVDFREQFSQEMGSIFERRAAERSSKGRIALAVFVAREFLSIMKNACAMRMGPIFTRPGPTPVASPCLPRNLQEAAEQRARAIRNMVACIGKHEFTQARHYSYEEIRLRQLVEQLQSKVPAEGGGTA